MGVPLVRACEVVKYHDDKVPVDVFAFGSDRFQQLLASLQAFQSVVIVLVFHRLYGCIIQFNQQLLNVLIYYILLLTYVFVYPYQCSCLPGTHPHRLRRHLSGCDRMSLSHCERPLGTIVW